MTLFSMINQHPYFFLRVNSELILTTLQSYDLAAMLKKNNILLLTPSLSLLTAQQSIPKMVVLVINLRSDVGMTGPVLSCLMFTCNTYTQATQRFFSKSTQHTNDWKS